MAHYGLNISEFREKMAMVWGTAVLRNLLKDKAVDEYTVRHKWLKEGGNPAREKITAICEIITMEPEDFNREGEEFAAAVCEAILRLTGRKVSAEDVVKKGRRLLDTIGGVEKPRASHSEYLAHALRPLRGVTKEKVKLLYERFKGKYYLYHYAITPCGFGDALKISRAVLNICDVEDSFMCVSVKWPDNAEEYKGVIAVGSSKWYFKLGSELSHEIAQMVTFDPGSIVMDRKRLHGILMGCTESLPQVPSAVKVLMVKMEGNAEENPVNLDADDVSEEIKMEISNLVEAVRKPFALQSSIPRRKKS